MKLPVRVRYILLSLSLTILSCISFLFPSTKPMELCDAGRSSGLESLADAESLEKHRKEQIPTILTPSYIAERHVRVRTGGS
jgi:hypothetical protein